MVGSNIKYTQRYVRISNGRWGVEEGKGKRGQEPTCVQVEQRPAEVIINS